MPYLIKCTTKYYGPEIKVTAICDAWGKVITFSSRREANMALSNSGLNKGEIHLSHNQASASRYTVARVEPKKDMTWRGYYLSDPITADNFAFLFERGLTQ